MIKTLRILAALTALSASATALSAQAEIVTADGVTFTYESAQVGKATIIKGVDSSTGKPFHLRVAHGWVEGQIGGKPVSFSTREVTHMSLATASNPPPTKIVSR